MGTEALDIGHHHDDDDDDGDDDCSYQATVVVQSGPQVFDRGNTGYGYIVVNRGGKSSWPQMDDQQDQSPELDWGGQAAISDHGAGHTGGDWWSNLFDEPLVSLDDLARQSGLKVKKPH